MRTSRRRTSAPAKVILFGEHFVVYGNPALLAAINKRTTADARVTESQRKITIESDLGISAEYLCASSRAIKRSMNNASMLDPIFDAISRVLVLRPAGNGVGVHLDLSSEVPYGIGLGSSAASCVATVAAVDSLFGAHDRQWICNKAVQAERTIHMNSSGADCYVSTFGGIMQYSRREGYTRIQPKTPLQLIVSSTGLRHSTGELVEKVRKLREAEKARFKGLALQASRICAAAVVAIQSGKTDEVGRLMTENQRLLKEIGVSHHLAETIIDLSLSAGALGAKITGAGGGGAVIALAASKRQSIEIVARLEKEDYESMEVQIDQKGLVYH